METPHFHEWFNKLFIPAVEDLTKTGPEILFLDCHNSHTALKTFAAAS
jgi:hypothetical protein